MTYEWDTSEGVLADFRSTIKFRVSERWELHSWNILTRMEGGERITPYAVNMFYAVWRRELKQGKKP